MLLENLRFHPEEEKNDPAFATALASLADLYVNDAFGAAHRAHASVEGITHHVRRAAAGLLMEQELQYLGHALESPERPFVAILGGAKVSDKIEVIENLLGKVDRLLIGGAMAYTFFKSRGVPIGQSLVEDDKLDAARDDRDGRRGARRALRAAGRSRRRPIASQDGTAHEVLAVGDPRIGDRLGVDIGPATITAYEARDRRREDRRLERADGRLRDRRVRDRHQRRRARGRRGEGHDDHRRRRLDRGGEEGRHRRPRSRTSRPAAAPRSSSSAAARCRASRR